MLYTYKVALVRSWWLQLYLGCYLKWMSIPCGWKGLTEGKSIRLRLIRYRRMWRDCSVSCEIMRNLLSLSELTVLGSCVMSSEGRSDSDWKWENHVRLLHGPVLATWQPIFNHQWWSSVSIISCSTDIALQPGHSEQTEGALRGLLSAKWLRNLMYQAIVR